MVWLCRHETFRCLWNLRKLRAKATECFSFHETYNSSEEVRNFIGSVIYLFFRVNALAAQDTLIGLRAYCSIVQARIVDQLSQLCDYSFIRNGVLIVDTKLSTAFTPTELLKVMKELPVLEQKRPSLRRTIDAMQRVLAAAEDE